MGDTALEETFKNAHEDQTLGQLWKYKFGDKNKSFISNVLEAIPIIKDDNYAFQTGSALAAGILARCPKLDMQSELFLRQG